MKLVDNIKNFFGFSAEIMEPEAYQNNYPYSPHERNMGVYAFPFDGEKTPYEMGEAFDFYPDYYTLRLRAWESFLKSDVVQNAIKKYCLWIVGVGLKLQSEPQENIFKLRGVDVSEDEIKAFTESVETQFRLFAEMVQSVYSNEYNLHEEAAETLKNAILAGDVLCINRFDGKYPTIEVIDGNNVQTPILTEHETAAEARGNKIINGVEIDNKKSHVAYYVKQDSGLEFKYERVEAYGKETGRRQAWLFYGQKYKKSDVRGMSFLTAVVETSTMMDRYKSATLGKAEENANLALQITHNQFSDGSNPFIQQMAQAMGKGKGVAPETETPNCDAQATKIAQTTKKQVVNMPGGAKLEVPTNGTDINFGEFFNVNIDIVYATLGIPPEVAMDKFGGAYSGSRAALKAWEYKMLVDRTKLMRRQFYKPFYDFWLDINILQNNVQAPGYLAALNKGDEMVLAAYRKARFIGALVPHIDPAKEVKAMREKLGGMFKDVPLESVEQIMEELNTGDLDATIKKVNNEKEMLSDFIANQSDPINPNSE